MKKILLTLLLVIGIASCKEAPVEDTSSSKHQRVDWELDNSTTYDDVQPEGVEDSGVSNGPTEWIWDGSQYDTLYTGATLRISHIDGDKVYLVMSK